MNPSLRTCNIIGCGRDLTTSMCRAVMEKSNHKELIKPHEDKSKTSKWKLQLRGQTFSKPKGQSNIRMGSLWNKKPGRKVQKVEAGAALVWDMGEGGWPGLRGPTRLLQPRSSFPPLVSLLWGCLARLSKGLINYPWVSCHS